MGWYSRYGGYPPYIPVAIRKEEAARKIEGLRKKGQVVNPVVIEGRTIAKTFWGKAWCKNLESYSDYANRLPRGRSCVRTGAVIDLTLTAGKIRALVIGASLYEVTITIKALSSDTWTAIINDCTGKIASLIELLQGTFSKAIMEVITQRDKGLFPHPDDITLKCTCPDYADMCKHSAAVLYGVGSRLDEQPETLFLLRNSNPMDLIAKAASVPLSDTLQDQEAKGITGDLSSLFGIDIEKTPSLITADEKTILYQEKMPSAPKNQRRQMKAIVPRNKLPVKDALIPSDFKGKSPGRRK